MQTQEMFICYYHPDMLMYYVLRASGHGWTDQPLAGHT